MIRCTIDGQEAIPSLKTSIKVTMENAHIKDRDSWSMDITFPMSIEENARIFANCHRIEVSRRVTKYEDCALYVNNQLVIRGIGIIVGVNHEEVKVQIKSGIQRIAYKSEFENVYIDRLQYTTKLPGSYDLAIYPNGGMEERIFLSKLTEYQTKYKDKYILASVYDTKNQRILNEIEIYCDPGEPSGGETPVDYYGVIHNISLQPNLNYVLRRVMSQMGYTMDANALRNVVGDLADAYICSSKRGTVVNMVLPHWTVKKFLDEVRRLYNITYIFDDDKKTVDIVPDNPLIEGVVEYECLDEFTTDYNEQGLSYVGASNLEYNLADSDYNSPNDISEKALQYFNKREFASWGDLQYAWENMSEQEKMTTIFQCPFGKYYTVKWKDAEEVEHMGLYKAKFQHLTRNEGSDNFITLNIVPVTIGEVNFTTNIRYEFAAAGLVGMPHSEKTLEWEASMYMPCVEGEEDDDSGEYLTVQSVLDNGGDVSEDEDERMEVMFLANVYKWRAFQSNQALVHYVARTVAGSNGVPTPQTFRISSAYYTIQCSTDPDANPDAYGFNRSFAIDKTTAATFIGQHHETVKIIENMEQTVIKFLTKDKPEPTKVHQFRNKRYLCEKIEMEIGENGIKEEKTGYFYEMI